MLKQSCNDFSRISTGRVQSNQSKTKRKRAKLNMKEKLHTVKINSPPPDNPNPYIVQRNIIYTQIQ